MNYQELIDEEYINSNPELSQIEKHKIRYIHNKLTVTPNAVYAGEELNLLSEFIIKVVFNYLDENPDATGHEGLYLGMMMSNFKSIQIAHNTTMSEGRDQYAHLISYGQTVWDKLNEFKEYLNKHIPDVLIIGFNISSEEAYSRRDVTYDPEKKYCFNEYYVSIIRHE